MIRHCVMLRLATDTPMGRVTQTMNALAGLVQQIEGCSNFAHGPNIDVEEKSVGFAHGFTFDARDAATLRRYAQHPEHLRFGAQLVSYCAGGAEGIMVFDLEVDR